MMSLRHQFTAVLPVMVLLPCFAAAQTTIPDIPALAQWEQQMLQYGAQHCQTLQSPSVSGAVKLDATYYDAERVYYQIADYTKDSKWLACAQAAESSYRDGYVLQHGGKVAGWMIFPHGLWKDFLRTSDQLSKDGVLQMAQAAAFGEPWQNVGSLSDPALSREVAYNLQAKLLAKDVGGAMSDNVIKLYADVAFVHMDAWFVHKTAPYIRPFMVALTSEALIVYFHKTGDQRVLPTLKMAWETLWNTTWVPNCLCFRYTDRIAPDGTGGMEPAPDLNMLIAPVFGWLYSQTGETKWIDRGDAIFSGGVSQAFLHGAKQFNQSYRWSFDYLAWRNKTNKVFVSFDSTPDSIAPAPPQGLRVQ